MGQCCSESNGGRSSARRGSPPVGVSGEIGGTGQRAHDHPQDPPRSSLSSTGNSLRRYKGTTPPLRSKGVPSTEQLNVAPSVLHPTMKGEFLLNMFIQLENTLNRDVCAMLAHVPPLCIEESDFFMDIIRISYGKNCGKGGRGVPLTVTSVEQVEALLYAKRRVTRVRRVERRALTRTTTLSVLHESTAPDPVPNTTTPHDQDSHTEVNTSGTAENASIHSEEEQECLKKYPVSPFDVTLTVGDATLRTIDNSDVSEDELGKSNVLFTSVARLERRRSSRCGPPALSVPSDDFGERAASTAGTSDAASCATPSPLALSTTTDRLRVFHKEEEAPSISVDIDCLHPEVLFYILRWYVSAPVIVSGATCTVLHPYKRVQSYTPSEGDMVAAMYDLFLVEDLLLISSVLKRGMRSSIKQYAMELLDAEDERNIRAGQRARKQSWWKDMHDLEAKLSGAAGVGTDTSKLATAEPYLKWRTKSISDGSALLRPMQREVNQDGSRIYTIVLDLDETLIYTRGAGAHLCVRPGSQELLKCLSGLGCEIIVWTASTKSYSAAILSHLDPDLRYISECVYRHDKWFNKGESAKSGVKGVGGAGHPRKDLSLLDRDLSHTLIVDNSVDCCYGYTETNAVLVPDFCGLEMENTLSGLCELFVHLVTSQCPVKEFLRMFGHNYLKKELRTANVGDNKKASVQCFVVDTHIDTNSVPFSIPVSLPSPRLSDF